VLKKRLGHSTLLMSLAASANSVISFVIFIVLSRILSPAEIGLVAFALIFVEAGKIIVNAGFPHAIVQHPVWDDQRASTCFYLNLLFALSIALFVFFIGAPLAARYYEAEAGPLLQVLSLIFFVDGIKAVHDGKLKREFAFRVIAIRSICGALAGGITGIYLAINGYGVWALVWQQLVNHSVVTVLTIMSSKWRPRLSFSPNHGRHLLAFSSPLMVAQLTGNISSKIFDILIGIVIGPTALGFFRIGGRVLYILQDVVLKPFEQTALSALARIEQRLQQALATLRLLRMSSYLTFPIFFGAAAIGPEFIIFAFGEKWSTSGNLMTILAIGSAPLGIGYQVNAALTASGHSRQVMMISSINLAVNILLAAASVPFGLVAAATGFALRSYFAITASLFFFNRVFTIGWLRVLQSVAPSFTASLAMFLIVIAAKYFLADQLAPLLRLLLLALLGAVAYAVLMLTLFRKETSNFLTEGKDLVPPSMKPVVAGLQRLTRLDQ
jgi:O-antigen/teichoic acid export membrane protein